VTVTPPGGWKPLDNATTGTAGVRSLTYYKLATATEPATYTFGFSRGAEAAGAIAAYAGVDPIMPVQSHAAQVNGTATTAHGSPNVSVPVASSELLSLFAFDGGTTASPGSGMAELWDRVSGGAVATTQTGIEAAEGLAGANVARTAVSSTSVKSIGNTIVLRAAAVPDTSAIRYSYSGPGDTADATLDTSGNVIESTIGLLGGVLLTKRASGDVWSYPNIHGDVMASANAAGAKVGPTLSYDPFGQALGSLPDNSASAFDYAWLGQHQRGTETAAGAFSIEMGARQYVPGLGRFLEVDPIEGGCSNDYAYVRGDPVNANDLSGMSTSTCMQAILRVFKDAFASGGVVGRYVAALKYRDGDKGHVEAFNNSKRRLQKAMRNLKNECFKGGGPGGFVGALALGAAGIGNGLLGLRYPGTAKGSGGGFRVPVRAVGTAFLIAGFAALVVATDGAAAPAAAAF
jgi:RHS repeat-associated protein